MQTPIRRVLTRLGRPGVVWTLAALELLVLAAENLLHFPLSVPYMRAATGGSVYLDMCAFCSATEVQSQLTAFGERGRLLQAWLLLSIDVVIPVLSCALAVAVFSLGLRPGRARRVLLGLASSALLLDFAENAAIGASLLQYPATRDLTAGAVGLLSGFKFIAYVLVLLALLGVGVRRWFGHRSAVGEHASAPRA